MEINSVQKRLLKTALYTSPLIAIMWIVPLVIIRSFSPLRALTETLENTFIILLIWAINWGVYQLIKKYSSVKYSNTLRYLLSYLLVFCTVFLIKYSGAPYPHFELPDMFYTDPAWAIAFSINAIILIIQNLHIIREEKLVIEFENYQLKLRNAEARNLKLKQQIHPHFLFNSLSILKTLIKKEPQTATKYVVGLSGFLRSGLSATNMNTVKLSEELDLSSAYLEMQKIRFQSSMAYDFHIPEKVRQVGYVPPFSIQLLLENAIKHNVMSQEKPLYIQVSCEDGWINVRNNRHKKEMTKPSNGIGLDNLAKRYQILTGDDVIIKPTEDTFSVSIKILDKEALSMQRLSVGVKQDDEGKH